MGKKRQRDTLQEEITSLETYLAQQSVLLSNETVKKRKKKSKKQKKGHSDSNGDGQEAVLTKRQKTSDSPTVSAAIPTVVKEQGSIAELAREVGLNTTSGSSNAVVDYPYEVSADDHCETPAEAYQDISYFLHVLATSMGKIPEKLAVYDPYHCEGSVIERLASVGFPGVYNKKEDCYAVWAAQKTPPYDVLLTNPPYSGEHMEKLLTFCMKSGKPWLLLIPNYVYMKDYYLRICAQVGAPKGRNNSRDSIFYVTPKKGRRYLYTTPKVCDFLLQLEDQLSHNCFLF